MKSQIAETVISLFSGTDARNWTKVQSVMAAHVKLDYSSMSGEPASILSPGQIIKKWKAFLPGFDCTHHQVSGFHVIENEQTAVAHYMAKADHYIGNVVWTVEGTYDTELTCKDERWFICSHKFNLVKQSGDTTLPSKAAEKVKSRNVVTAN